MRVIGHVWATDITGMTPAMRRRTIEPPRRSPVGDPLVEPRPGGVVDRLGRAAWPVLFVVVALTYAAGAESASRIALTAAATAAMAGAATTGEVLRAVRQQLHHRLGAVDVGLSLHPPDEVAIGPHDVAIAIPDTTWTKIVRWVEDRMLDEPRRRPGHRRGSGDDGLDRLLTVVTGVRRLGPDALCEAVVDAMPEGRAPRDDVAMLVARPVPTRFEHEMPAASSELAPLRRGLSRWLARIGTDPDDIADILIAVGEGAANAVEHASRDGEAGTVQVVVELDGDDLRTTILDRGSWRGVSAPGDRGRGAAIMRVVSKQIDVRCEPDGTTVVIAHRLPRTDRTLSR